MKVKIKNFENLLSETTRLIDPKIKELLSLYTDDDDKRTNELIHYQIETGGKKIRPVFCMASCLLFNGKISNALYSAAGLEILHNYTLIIDDIIDNSYLRRNKPTTWAKFGKAIALCAGADYSATIFQAANKSKNPVKISELFAKTIKTIFDGQILDILFEQSGREDERYIIKNRYKKITQADYIKMISKKTAILIETSCEVGGICANANQTQITTLKKYGFNLGMAFQIQDDILDIFGDEKKFGKEIGHDIKGKKLSNIVILFAMEEIAQADKKTILNILKKEEVNNNDVKEVIKLINKTSAKERACLLGERYIKKAKESLKKLPQNNWNNILNEIADFIVKREK